RNDKTLRLQRHNATLAMTRGCLRQREGSSLRWNDRYSDGEKEIPASAGIEISNQLQILSYQRFDI
ncbi:MAG: hypothetical protein ACOYKR_12395, partial [Sphingobacterium thalpophilum]